MRFRLPDWDVAMPPALVAYWTAWNTRDLGQVRGLLDSAVTPEVEWNDPRESFVGIDELERAIRRLRTSKPNYDFSIVSEVDCHHRRFRYRWDMSRNGRTLMEGLDIVTTTEPGLIQRVDGFFGPPTPIKELGSGVPAPLRGGSS